MRPQDSLSPDYFEGMFRGDRDPWKFETSPYEAAKYDATLAALRDRRYACAFEVGCANGVLTQRIAARCGYLLAIDVSATALASASERCAALEGVDFAEMQFPDQTPTQTYDLIVMSEVVYYWSRDDIERAAGFIDNHLARGGDLLLVHWIGETDYPHSGDDAVRILRGHLPSLHEQHAMRTDQYRLDLWRKA